MLPVWISFSERRLVEGSVPQWWLNFITTGSTFPHKDINNELQPFDAKLIRNRRDGGISVVFRDSQAMTYFLMRWS